MKSPTITPLEALNRHKVNENKDFEHEGFRFYLDGPMMCPVEEMASVAEDLEDESNMWFTTGEPGDVVTEANTWIQV